MPINTRSRPHCPPQITTTTTISNVLGLLSQMAWCHVRQLLGFYTMVSFSTSPTDSQPWYAVRCDARADTKLSLSLLFFDEKATTGCSIDRSSNLHGRKTYATHLDSNVLLSGCSSPTVSCILIPSP